MHDKSGNVKKVKVHNSALNKENTYDMVETEESDEDD